MLGWFTGDGRRRRAASGLSPGPLRSYLETPLPGRGTPLSELPLVAMDVETTGLDPRRDRVLSVGMVPVDGDRIRLGGAETMLLRSEKPEEDGGVGQSATLHRLTDDVVATGVSAETFLGRILTAMTGRVLVAHFSRIETDFLGALCVATHGVRPRFLAVDTLDLQRRVLGGRLDRDFTSDSAPEELRLWVARERYGLPHYRAHDALSDALACAELYLAQTSELHERGVTTLRDLGTA